ncbi:2-oxo-4-hydroxy-4-carboxy-5-ureidoimidazoline decarboxylase [Microbacterium sp. ASV81]|uniref:2-oxo-4-hydroxy-4-carboxy-5-ureidoimidazoline decarboxylase n=1 Tax=Microbacterium capsulatum TaxID=3041921 RepID=A0ABU0XK28_9MICO|nr:2-oxo-4-hydroxy-4-carboxy-5-ureidoimidazoline decarboxylase [Microbacterium sp. ASV81]MDQ4214485.1 2-oxo-4-hydroxy-4-carboxy-5-ureidoimidazoline decarboxylase [Microbacterium sp. ASV81]
MSNGLDVFNAYPTEELTEILFESCHLPVRRFADAVTAARPYDSVDALVATAQAQVADLTEDEVRSAHNGLDRIGIVYTGNDAESRWSRDEEGGIAQDAETAKAFDDANQAYEDRHGHVFLICATGLSGDEILSELHRRTALDDAAENEQIKSELRGLMNVRLPKILGALASA